MASESDYREWQKIVAEAWADDAFRQRLIADPKAVLAERGIECEEDVEIQVVQGDKKVHYLVLPPKPEGEYENEVMDYYANRLTTKAAVLTTAQTAKG